ncbi:MAG: DUF3575 domain-containing protein [Bacteroidota bacterium]
MRRRVSLCCAFFCIWVSLSPTFGQVRTHLGMNIPALLMGTLDLQAEMALASKLSLHLGSAIRVDGQNSVDPTAGSFLRDYTHIRDRSMSLSVGIRLFDESASYYQYPYMTFSAVGVYYEDLVQYVDPQDNTSLIIGDFQGVKLGGTATIGVVVIITDHITLDLAAQMGYIRPRTDIPSFVPYYFPGMGYSTFGLGVLGVEGGHIQPIISLRYNIVRDKRQRIHDKE